MIETWRSLQAPGSLPLCSQQKNCCDRYRIPTVSVQASSHPWLPIWAVICMLQVVTDAQGNRADLCHKSEVMHYSLRVRMSFFGGYWGLFLCCHVHWLDNLVYQECAIKDWCCAIFASFSFNRKFKAGPVYSIILNYYLFFVGKTDVTHFEQLGGKYSINSLEWMVTLSWTHRCSCITILKS